MAHLTHLNDLEWSRWLGHDLGLWERLRVRRHLRACESCAAQASRLEVERRAFESDPRFARAVDGLTTSAARSSRPAAKRSWWPAFSVASLAAGAAVVFFLLPGSNDLQSKGTDLFAWSLHRGDETLPFGDKCFAGDAVRASYVMSKPGYLMVLGTGSTRQVQQLYPASGDTSEPVDRTGTTPGSWVLDATPGRQCFSAVFSSTALRREAVEPLLKAVKTPSGVQVFTRCCEKASP
jgi:hypothetical protein